MAIWNDAFKTLSININSTRNVFTINIYCISKTSLTSHYKVLFTYHTKSTSKRGHVDIFTYDLPEM